MKKILPFFFLFVATVSVSGQTAEMAEQQFNNADYAAAKVSYEALLKKSPQSPLYLYRYARCAQETGDYNTAIAYFLQAGSKYALRDYFLGECYFHTQQMEQAVACYETYLAAKPDTDRREHIENRIQAARKMQRYLNRVTVVAYLDSVEVAKKDLLTVYDLSAEAGRLFRRDSLMYGYVNQLGGQRFFASGNDSVSYLFTQYHLLDTWSEAEQLPASVQIGARQNAPYMLADGVTLYFASDAEDGLGGMDIYVTRHNVNNDTYTRPENIGLPFNSTGNDYLYVLDETRGVGYWATDVHSAADSVRVYKFKSGEPLLWSAQSE